MELVLLLRVLADGRWALLWGCGHLLPVLGHPNTLVTRRGQWRWLLLWGKLAPCLLLLGWVAVGRGLRHACRHRGVGSLLHEAGLHVRRHSEGRLSNRLRMGLLGIVWLSSHH